MPKERIEKTLIILNEEEVRRVLLLAQHNDGADIYEFVKQVIARKVEDALRRRCG